jgi:hypothetical protein
MEKKINLILIFLIINLIFNSNFLYSESEIEVKEEIVLDVEFSCYEYPVNFKIYTESQFENKREINDDDDLFFHNITSDFTVYDGPFRSRTVLKKGKTNKKGEFEINFEKPDFYLIEITPEDSKYAYLEKTVPIKRCNKLKKIVVENESNLTDDLINDSETEIFEDIKEENNSDNDNETEINITENKTISNVNLTKPVPTKIVSKKNQNFNVTIIILILVVCIVFGVGIFVFKNKYKKKKSELSKTEDKDYELKFQMAKNYILKYKDRYSKDILYKILKKYIDDEEIIKKAFEDV